MKANFPANTPPYLVEWLSRPSTANQSFRQFLERLVGDERMASVWPWVEALPSGRTGHPSFTVCHCAYMATIPPRKPGNLTPAERRGYFQKVRKHAKALIELLEGTGFGLGSWTEEEVDLDKLEETVRSDLKPWGSDDENGEHIVAYRVGDESITRLPYTYPDSHLVELLHQLEPWTEQDDYWDLWGTGSSKPIVHAHSASTKVIYFDCTLYRMLQQMLGTTVPFTHLSTIANVALKLGPDDLVDEEAVRKQVRRYEDRIRKENSGGQKSEE